MRKTQNRKTIKPSCKIATEFEKLRLDQNGTEYRTATGIEMQQQNYLDLTNKKLNAAFDQRSQELYTALHNTILHYRLFGTGEANVQAK